MMNRRLLHRVRNAAVLRVGHWRVRERLRHAEHCRRIRLLCHRRSGVAGGAAFMADSVTYPVACSATGSTRSTASATAADPDGVCTPTRGAREQARVVSAEIRDAISQVVAARAGQSGECEQQQKSNSASHGGRPPGPEGTRAGNKPMSDPSESARESVPRLRERNPSPAGIFRLFLMPT